MQVKHLFIAAAMALSLPLAGQAAYAGAAPGAVAGVEKQAAAQEAGALVQVHHHWRGGGWGGGWGGPFFWGGPYYGGCGPYDDCGYGYYGYRRGWYGGHRGWRGGYGHHGGWHGGHHHHH